MGFTKSLAEAAVKKHETVQGAIDALLAGAGEFPGFPYWFCSIFFGFLRLVVRFLMQQTPRNSKSYNLKNISDNFFWSFWSKYTWFTSYNSNYCVIRIFLIGLLGFELCGVYYSRIARNWTECWVCGRRALVATIKFLRKDGISTFLKSGKCDLKITEFKGFRKMD